MRVAFYNQMFGMNGRSLGSSIAGHWAVHRRKNPSRIYDITNLNKTYDLIKESNPDIVGLCEVVEGQEQILSKLLTKDGYNCFFARGHRTKASNLHLGVMIASKLNLRKIENKIFPVEHKMGGGGGFIHCNIPDLDTEVLGVHLSNGKNPNKKDIYSLQLDFLRNYVDSLDRRVILIGDFNGNFEDIKHYFPELKLASKKMKTCTLTPPFKFFFNQDIDHIFIRGFHLEGNGSLEGQSDHRLIYADLE
jgi:exonuclease III